MIVDYKEKQRRFASSHDLAHFIALDYLPGYEYVRFGAGLGLYYNRIFGERAHCYL
jgi:hypothetical protein